MSEQTSLPKPAALRGKIAPVKFAHAVMRTSRFQEMVDWYKTVLEAEVTFGDANAAFLTYDEEHHRIAILNMPLLLRRPSFLAGVEHIAFTYRSLGDLAATYRRLGGLGTRPYWCVNHGGTTSMYYKDPDGNRVELQIDNFEDPDELNAFLYGPAFKINGIGVDFDPEDLFARHDAGEPFEELVRWKEIVPRGPDSVPVAHLGRLHGFLVRLLGRRRR
jgi:catechol 2,3-dioxygenase-like lactoylglutathione lyase family enzyme